MQISVHDDRLLFWNDGHLPDTRTVANLTHKHPSVPFNPDVANTLFRAGYIEAWGRGMIKMIVECQHQGIPAPHYAFGAGGCTVEFFRYTEASLQQRGLREDLRRIVLVVQKSGEVTNSAVQQLLGVSKSTAT